MKFSGLSLYLIIPIVTNGQSTWQQKADCPDSPRWGMVSFELDGVGYMIGGRSDITDLTDVWAYDPLVNSWEPKASIPGARRVAAAFAVNGKGYVTCGLYGGSLMRNDLWEYDPMADTWAQKADLPAAPRYGCAGFSSAGKGYVCSGSIGSGIGPYVSELWAYDPVNDEWSARADVPDQARVGASAFTANGLCYLFGGRQTDQTMTNELWAYDPLGNTWSSMAPMPSVGRHYARTYSVQGFGLVVAGLDPIGSVFDCWLYNPVSNSWYTAPEYTGGGGWAALGFCVDDRVFAGLGQTDGGAYYDLWELKDLTIGIEEIVPSGNAQFAPNPSRTGDRLDIVGTLNEIGQYEIQINNAQGQCIIKLSMNGANFSGFPDLAPGSYYVVLRRGEIVLTRFSHFVLN